MQRKSQPRTDAELERQIQASTKAEGYDGFFVMIKHGVITDNGKYKFIEIPNILTLEKQEMAQLAGAARYAARQKKMIAGDKTSFRMPQNNGFKKPTGPQPCSCELEEFIALAGSLDITLPERIAKGIVGPPPVQEEVLEPEELAEPVEIKRTVRKNMK